MKFNGLLCIVCSSICAVFIGSSEGAITAWTVPVISGKDGSGALATPVDEDLASGTTTGFTLALTGATGAVTFTFVSQPTAGKLTLTAGEIFLGASASFDFETEPTYIFVVKAVDSAATPETATATVTLSIADVNEAPAFGASQYSLTIPDGSTAGTTLIAVPATDQEGDGITYSIDAGNTNTDFAISNTGVITVAMTKTLTQSTTGGYELVVKAVDDGSPVATGSTTIWAVVKTCGASAAMVGIMTLTLVAISMFV